MKALSTSEEQVMAALWACGKPATRRQIAAKLPPDCVWADSTLLNFLLRLEAKGYVCLLYTSYERDGDEPPQQVVR